MNNNTMQMNNELTPDQIAASLAFNNRIMEERLASQNPENQALEAEGMEMEGEGIPQDMPQEQPTEMPQETAEPQEDTITPRIDELEGKFGELEASVKQSIKDEMEGMKAMLKELLNDDDEVKETKNDETEPKDEA